MTGSQAGALLRMVAVDPERAYTRALKTLRRPGAVPVVGVLRAAALAAKELGRPEEGIDFLGQALARADEYEAAQVRMNLVGLLAARGDVPAALAQAERAAGVLRGADADRLAANRACALARAGRLGEAREEAARALARLRRGDDAFTLCGLLTNLGLAAALRGDLEEAEATVGEAVVVAREAGMRHQEAMATANLAFVVSRRGDLPRALRLFAAAEPGLAGERIVQTRFDQAETLIQAGLPGEARPTLAAALADAAAHGRHCDAADGMLLLAHAELADGDPERAAQTAERARATFAEQERTGWMLLAEHLVLRARWASGERSTILLGSAAVTADRLARGGWAEASAEARIIAARVALALRRPAGHLLAPVLDVRGPASLRVAFWHATALERWERHDPRGARAAVWAGLRAAEEHADVFGALDLRARAAGLGAELADLGLRLARSARELLTAEERRRASARRPDASRPHPDPERAAALAELRVLSTEHTVAAARGDVTRALAARLAGAEARLQAGARRRPASLPNGAHGAGPCRADLPDIAAALGDRVLLEFVRIGDELHAVTVRDGRPRRHRLCAYEEAGRAVELARFAARRLAEREDDAQAVSGLASAAATLDNLLFGPLASELPDGADLVIAPTGRLHGLPWAAVPSLSERPFTVVPSAHAWLHAALRPPGRGAPLLVAGPGLGHAEREVAALALLYPSARVLGGPAARVETVRDALAGCGLAHVAAHGEFREGNGLFSELRLADGPLLVHDLEEPACVPRTVVLSACDAGRAEGGDAVIGMAGVLLALGASTVIASVTPVLDAATPAFMTAFHTALAKARLSPARALASVPRTPGVLGFLCFGAG